MTQTAYEQLEKRFRRISVIGNVNELLDWDRAVMMPLGASNQRGEEVSEMAALGHELLSDSAVGELLDAADEQSANLDQWQQANLRQMRSRFIEATAVPSDLVAAKAKMSNDLEARWRGARAESDFSQVQKPLGELIELTRQEAEAVGEAKGQAAYDALMGLYSPGQTKAEVDPLFDDYAAFLPVFLGRVLERQAQRPALTDFDGALDIDAQKQLAAMVLGQLGFDFERGRLDASEHPFCSGTRDDVRMTGRYREDELGLMAPIHECGHAMYEKQLPADWAFQPVGANLGMAIHESQSLLLELQVGRSPAFVRYLSGLLPQYLGEQAAFENQALLRRLNHVEPSFIRVEADEVTYPAHVILRYRLEQALLSGDLSVADLPGAWNQGMQDLLGITPPNDTLGVLQDIHWYAGLMGYFPSYSLGAMIAAQFFEAAEAAMPDIHSDFERGDFTRLQAWLAENIHGQGCLLTAPQLIKQVTGKPLDIGIFKQHLENRYLN